MANRREMETAIKQINGVHSILMQSHVSVEHCMEYKESARIAVEALEKQIPKKPKRLNYANIWYCPVCEFSLLFMSEDPTIEDSYCSVCGQKIDWEVE